MTRSPLNHAALADGTRRDVHYLDALLSALRPRLKAGELPAFDMFLKIIDRRRRWRLESAAAAAAETASSDDLSQRSPEQLCERAMTLAVRICQRSGGDPQQLFAHVLTNTRESTTEQEKE